MSPIPCLHYMSLTINTNWLNFIFICMYCGWLVTNHSTESKIQFPTTGCMNDSVIFSIPQKVLLLWQERQGGWVLWQFLTRRGPWNYQTQPNLDAQSDRYTDAYMGDHHLTKKILKFSGRNSGGGVIFCKQYFLSTNNKKLSSWPLWSEKDDHRSSNIDHHHHCGSSS